MYKLILAVFCLSGFVSRAQNGCYLQPQVGVGTSGVAAHDNLKLGTYENVGHSNVGVFNFQLGVGYRLNQWEISTGIFLLQSGYYEHTLSGYMFRLDTKTTQYYNHIALPLVAAFRFSLGKRFSIAPGFGYALSCNYSDNKTVNQDGIVTKQMLTGSAFSSQYRGTSLWALMRLGFGYRLNNQLAIVAGPGYDDMVSSMLPPGYNVAAYQYSRVFSLNGGITWSFGKRGTAGEVP